MRRSAASGLRQIDASSILVNRRAVPVEQELICKSTNVLFVTEKNYAIGSFAQRLYQLDMLYIIGLGLADEKDVSVKGLEVIRRAERVYLEAYTAVLLVDQKQLVRSISARRATHPY